MAVNDVIVDFPMKVGEAGEAFFIFETEKEVPEELQTSPLAGPSLPAPNAEVLFSHVIVSTLCTQSYCYCVSRS